MKKMFLLIGCACLAGWFMWSEGLTHVSPVPEAPVVAEVEQPEYMVYITGAVRKPGLYSFPDVVTIGDAVHAAGDALPYAEASAVNYAARIEDGMQIHLPYNLDGVPAASESDGKININDADETKLTELPGIVLPWPGISSSTETNMAGLPIVSSCSRSKASVLPSLKS